MLKPVVRDGHLYSAEGVWLGPDTEAQRHQIMKRWTREIAKGIRQRPDEPTLKKMKKSELANICLEMGYSGIGEQTNAELIRMILEK